MGTTRRNEVSQRRRVACEGDVVGLLGAESRDVPPAGGP